MHKLTANGPVFGTYIGYLTLGDLVLGTALSPDGSILYATSQDSANGSYPGFLSVIDVETFEEKP